MQEVRVVAGFQVLVKSTEDDRFEISVPALGQTTSSGTTLDDALKNIETEIKRVMRRPPGRLAKVTERTIEVKLAFYGSGRVRRKGGTTFRQPVVPEPSEDLYFSMHREVLDENEIMNPELGEDSVEGGFQINLFGNSASYRELGRYFLALAELDISEDPYGYHDHFVVLSQDGRTRLHIIVRKHKN